MEETDFSNKYFWWDRINSYIKKCEDVDSIKMSIFILKDMSSLISNCIIPQTKTQGERLAVTKVLFELSCVIGGLEIKHDSLVPLKHSYLYLADTMKEYFKDIRKIENTNNFVSESSDTELQ